MMTGQGLRRLSQIGRQHEADRTFSVADRQLGAVRGKGNGGKRGGEVLFSLDLAVYQIHNHEFSAGQSAGPGFRFRPPGQRQKLAIGRTIDGPHDEILPLVREREWHWKDRGLQLCGIKPLDARGIWIGQRNRLIFKRIGKRCDFEAVSIGGSARFRRLSGLCDCR